jgi:hypothetical protein
MVVTACSEDLQGGAGCPVLCPGQALSLRDTVLEADVVVVDTTLAGYPPRGGGTYLLLANSGDTLDARFVVRFDSLTASYIVGTDTTPITAVDSATVRIFVDSALSTATEDVTIEIYDVDSEVADSLTEALLPLFTPDRLLGSATFAPEDLADSLDIDLANATIAAKIQGGERLRLGFRVRSDEPVRLAVFNTNTLQFPRLRYDPNPGDPSLSRLIVLPRSLTPAGEPPVALDFTDYSIVAAGQATVASDLLALGGARGRRVYFRFDLPARLTDSTTIVRASFVLHQSAAPTYGFEDTILVIPQVVLASAEIGDLARAAMVIDTVPGVAVSALGLPPTRIAPQDEQEVRIEIVNAVRTWRSADAERIPHAILLRTFNEGRSPIELRFHSTEADPLLRPRLLITYVPRTDFGIP